MQNHISPNSLRMLILNTLAFTICFAVWTFNGVMVTYLSDNHIFDWGPIETGWLLGIPILTGSIFRLPAGILTDRYGGKWVFALLLLVCALPMFLLSFANSFVIFVLLSFGFGLAGTGFAVGIAYTSVWYPKNWQGRALGIFGAGNAGAAITTLLAPTLLNQLTSQGAHPEKWRYLPIIYAAMLIVMSITFMLFAVNKKADSPPRTIKKMMQPLKNIRVWRFGFYYFLVFGCFVAFSQWLVPYFVNVYGASLVIAGLFASLFSLPSGVIRALGGWMSDKLGARKVMIWVFKSSIILSALLMIPRMDIITPGKGQLSTKEGIVKNVSESAIEIDGKTFDITPKSVAEEKMEKVSGLASYFPYKYNWQDPVVSEGEVVKRKQLIAKGTTVISFQANIYVFASLMLLIGIVWGIGKAGVYRFIPDYFPNEVGVVGGMVGVIGGLGGFFCPILFGYLLNWTGLWTSSWMLMLAISILCLYWMQSAIRGVIKKKSPELAKQIEYRNE